MPRCVAIARSETWSSPRSSRTTIVAATIEARSVRAGYGIVPGYRHWRARLSLIIFACPTTKGNRMGRVDVWTGTVVKKSRKLLDGSNLYRQVTVQTDTGTTEKIRVDRALWKELKVGDRLVRDAGREPRPA